MSFWTFTPDNPEPSVARVAISNSKEDGGCGSSGNCANALVPVTWMIYWDNLEWVRVYPDLIPGGRTQVGDKDVCPRLGTPRHQAPLLLPTFPLIRKLTSLGIVDMMRKVKFHHLWSTAKETDSQLASCQPSKWTLKLFSEDSMNLSGSGTVASRQGSARLKDESGSWKT